MQSWGEQKLMPKLWNWLEDHLPVWQLSWRGWLCTCFLSSCSPPSPNLTPLPLTDWLFSGGATSNNRPTPLSHIIPCDGTLIHFAYQNNENGKLNMFIIILFGRNWSTYLHREFTLQTSRCLCASSVWLSCHMHYWPFHIAMTLKTVSTRNTKLVKIAIEPIARAFATPWNIKQIQNQNSRAHIFLYIKRIRQLTYGACLYASICSDPIAMKKRNPKKLNRNI